jgi:acyl carrier protein
VTTLVRDLPDLRPDAGVPEAGGADVGNAGTGSPLRQRLAEAADGDRAAILTDAVRGYAAAALGYPSTNDIAPDSSFVEIGLSSFAALELSNRLNEAAGLKIPAAAIFDHPTPADLAEYVRTGLADHLEGKN